MNLFQQMYLFAVIARPKFLGMAEHIGILLPDGRVAHCVPGHGECISTLAEFLAGQKYRIVRHVPPERQRETLQRIGEALRTPKQYDALMNNCEMFVNRVIGEEPTSPQLRGIVGLLAVATCLGLAASR